MKIVLILFGLDVHEKHNSAVSGNASQTLPVYLFPEVYEVGNHELLILFHLDLYENPILEGSTRLPVYLFPEVLRSQNCGPGEGGWGRWQSRETNIRERLTGTAELGFHISLSEK